MENPEELREEYEDRAKKLIRLSKYQAKLLFMQSVEGKKHSEVNILLGRTEKQENQTQREYTSLYKTLRLPKTDLRKKEDQEKYLDPYGNILFSVRKSIQAIEEDWPPRWDEFPIRDEKPQEVEPPPEEPDRRPQRPIFDPEGSRDPRLGCILAFIILIVIGVLVASWGTIRNALFPPTPTPTITPYPSPTPLPPTHTFTPSQTPTITPTPTITLIPSSTVTPTFTPSLTPTIEPGTILFEDDFDDGLDPAWSILSGSPTVVNGKLTASGTTWLAIGDVFWTNYKIEFDADSDNFWNAIGLRVESLGNMVAFYWHDFYRKWEVVVNGDRDVVPGTETSMDSKGLTHFEILAEGNTFTVYINGMQVPIINDTRYPNGRIALRIGHYSVFDNFKVTKLP